MTYTIICFYIGLLLFCPFSALSLKQTMSKIYNCIIYILIILPYVYTFDYFFFYSIQRTVWDMWYEQYVIDFPYRTETF